jgi:hypothetical protein
MREQYLINLKLFEEKLEYVTFNRTAHCNIGLIEVTPFEHIIVIISVFNYTVVVNG